MKYLVLLILCVSCWTAHKRPEGVDSKDASQNVGVASVKSLPAPLHLQWKSVPGRLEKNRYYSHSQTRTLEGTEVRHVRDEVVEFTVMNKVVLDSDSQGTSYVVQTIEKEGYVNLNELAFPELGEVLDLVVDRKGTVLKAGKYSADSIFFVPPISLPLHPVLIGSSWPLSHTWKTASSGIQLRLDLVSTLKNVFSCGKEDSCAEIEVAGGVSVLPEKTPVSNSRAGKSKPGESRSMPNQIESRVFGRIVFALKTSSLVWSEMRNRERFEMDGTKIEVSSCIVSALTEPFESRWSEKYKVFCNPNEDLVGSVPEK